MVVSRGLCRFGRFDFSRLPAARRSSALALHLQSWSPFAQADWAVAWTDGGWAQVWCWDRAALMARLSAQTPPVKPTRAVPETALRGPGADGLRLCEALDGYEGGQWLAGELLASRWWRQLPSPGEWLAFQRDCGLAPEQLTAMPEAERPPLAARPWRPLEGAGGAAGALGTAELATYGALLLALGIPLLALAVGQVRLAQATAAAQAELATQTTRSQTVITARETALTAAEQLRGLQELQPYPPPLVLMQAIARALPDSAGVSAREWELNEGRLRLLLVASSGEIAGSELVRALELTGLFGDIKILTQADARQIGFMLTLRAQSALALPPDGPASGAASSALND